MTNTCTTCIKYLTISIYIFLDLFCLITVLTKFQYDLHNTRDNIEAVDFHIFMENFKIRKYTKFA